MVNKVTTSYEVVSKCFQYVNSKKSLKKIFFRVLWYQKKKLVLLLLNFVKFKELRVGDSTGQC